MIGIGAVECMFMTTLLPMTLVDPFLIYNHTNAITIGFLTAIHVLLVKLFFFVAHKAHELGISAKEIISENQIIHNNLK